MRDANRPMTIQEAHDAIVAANLYQFKADAPVHIVRNEIRRHCYGLDFSSASPKKLFKITEDGRYFILDSPVQQTGRKLRRVTPKVPTKFTDLEALKKQHEKYLLHFKNRVVEQLKQLHPKQFERFCRNLLAAYGFRDVHVTRYCKDGGIDGFGKLKVGFDYFNVAFQCKRRTKGNVGRPEISQFRGDIQGQYDMGVFFTTARFTPEAKTNSLRLGAVPVTCIDGPTTVDIMLDKKFGVEQSELPIYALALELTYEQ
jgi:restriction system protein